MATLGDSMFTARLAADPAYFATAQPWPPASAYPEQPTCLPISTRPANHLELTRAREKYEKLKLRLWNLESRRTRSNASWEVEHLKAIVEDLRRTIAKAAAFLGRRPRLKKGARQPP